MTQHPSFDLRDAPWIPVLSHDGKYQDVSLREVFATASTLASIHGDLPTQTVAIYRLLLAILHRTVVTVEEAKDDQWKCLWDRASFPTDQINTYLDAHADRFDLLHPVTPFYQVAHLRTASGRTSGLKALIADIPNGHAYFTTRSGPALQRIPFAEAARWLIHCQAFDPSGIKSGALGDDRVKGGRGYPIGLAWAGSLGHVLAEGRSVFETLLLNLVLIGPDGAPLPPADRPVWERPPHQAAVEARPGQEPDGPVDVLTWQSRRIRLIHDGSAVTDALVSNGDPLSQQNRHRVEFATGWRRSEPQENKLKEPLVYMPAVHGLGRSFWRGLTATLPQTVQSSSGRDAALRRPPQVLTWLARLRSDDLLDADFPLRLHAIGVQYGSNNSVVDEIIDDVLLVHADVLSNEQIRTHATDAVSDADNAVKALVSLAGNLAAAAGGESKGVRTQSRESAFFALDGPYRVWLSALISTTNLTTHRADWQNRVAHIISTIGRQLINDAGTPAWIGREVRGTLIDTSLASRWFDSALAKALSTSLLQQASTPQQPAVKSAHLHSDPRKPCP